MLNPLEPLVVVFGGAGYIGSSLAPKLLEAGYRVRIFDNFLFGEDGLQHLKSDNLEVIDGDLTDIKAVSYATRDADAVILLAALVGHRVEDVNWVNVRNVNLFGSEVVLQAALEHGAQRFIFASTASVYGLQSGVMYETSTPAPVSLYSRLKLRMESRIISAKNRSFHPTALRVATCHGYSSRMRFDLVVNGMMRDAICKKEIVIQGGDQWRPLVHVDDAASAFVHCLKAHENLISGSIFNVGHPEQNLTVTQVAKAVQQVVPEVEIKIIEAEPDLVDHHLSSKKIEKILDFHASWELERSLAELRNALLEGYFEDPYSLKYQNT